MSSAARTASALVVLLVLTACGSSGEPTAAPSGPTASDSAAPEESNLTFEAGDDLSQDDLLQWGDTMLASDDYEVLKRDDGQGRWAYTHTPTGCDVVFVQTRVSELDAARGDAELTDQFIADQFQVPLAEVEREGDDTTLAYGLSGGRTVDVRALSATRESGAREINFARTFGQPGLAMLTVVRCADDASDPAEAVKAIAPDLRIIPGAGG